MGVCDIGLTQEAFWATTPRQFSFMLERYRDREKRADRRAGGVIAMLYNINRDSKRDPSGLDWQDFFTEWKEESGEQSEEEMLQTMMLFTKQREGLPS